MANLFASAGEMELPFQGKTDNGRLFLNLA
jgi:hypothetical protein